MSAVFAQFIRLFTGQLKAKLSKFQHKFNSMAIKSDGLISYSD